VGASCVQCLRIGQEHILKYVHFEKTKGIKYSPSTIWIYVSSLRLRIPLFVGGRWIIGGARKFSVLHSFPRIRILAYMFIHNTFRNCFCK
jgi:uncharacterized integral membrane protein